MFVFDAPGRESRPLCAGSYHLPAGFFVRRHEMNMIAIHGWDRCQSFRKDRGAPPWIKVFRKVLTNHKIAMLSDCEFGQLVKLWIVAAEYDGKIPDDPDILRKIASLDATPNISKYIDLRLMTPTCQPNDVNLTPTCQPNDVNLTHQSRDRVETEESRDRSETPLAPSRKNSTVPSAPKINFDYETRKFEGITPQDIDEWEAAYPAIDIDLEIKRAALWLANNPSKRKKKVRRFITNWLSRTQERGGTRNGTLPYQQPDDGYRHPPKL